MPAQTVPTIPASPARKIGSQDAEHWFEANAQLPALLMTTLAFAVRLWAASGTFLNPDEALHFQLANQSSWAQAYRASLTSAHPPGLIFLLHYWRMLGSSELFLRLPSVMAGAAFCWICFLWVSKLFGRTAGWIAFVLLGFLPPLVELSAELRQYELLLLFIAASAYLLELAFEKDSPLWMLLSAVSLYLAMATHYSALLFAASLGIYAAARIIVGNVGRGAIAMWLAGQAGAAGFFLFLYRTHISQLHGNNGEGTHLFAANSFLHSSYFYPGQENPLVFVAAKTGGVFQYIFGQLVVGDIAFLLFLAAIVILARRGRTKSSTGKISSWQLAVLLALPFVLNSAAGLAGRYPYGGNRHCVFLAMFAVAGISCVLASMVRGRTLRGVAVALVLAGVCVLLGKPRQPYILRADQNREHMQQAIQAIEGQIRPSEIILADYESGLLLGHYLCAQNMISFDNSQAGFQKFTCSGRTVIAMHPEPMILTGENFLGYWQRFLKQWDLRAGERIWVFQAGWDVHLAEQLQLGSRAAQPGSAGAWMAHPVQVFGNSINLFALDTGESRSYPASKHSRPHELFPSNQRGLSGI